MNTAFIGLDYVIDIMHPTGKIAASAQEAIRRDVVAHTNRALEISRQREWLNVLVKVGFSAGYVDHPGHSAMFGRAKELNALELGSPGAEFHPDLAAHLADIVVCKPRVSAFYCTNLDAALRARRIERLIISGISSTWAVQSTVRDAHDRDYLVLVLEDACAATTQEEHQHSMDMLSRIARVITTDELAGL